MAQIFMHHQALAAGYVHFVTRYCDRSQRENIPYTENGPELITISSRHWQKCTDTELKLFEYVRYISVIRA